MSCFMHIYFPLAQSNVLILNYHGFEGMEILLSFWQSLVLEIAILNRKIIKLQLGNRFFFSSTGRFSFRVGELHFARAQPQRKSIEWNAIVYPCQKFNCLEIERKRH